MNSGGYCYQEEDIEPACIRYGITHKMRKKNREDCQTRMIVHFHTANDAEMASAYSRRGRVE